MIGCTVAVSLGAADVGVGCKVELLVGSGVCPDLCSISCNNERRASVVGCKAGVKVAVGTGVDVGFRLQAVSARKIVIVAVVILLDCMDLGYQTDVLKTNRGRSRKLIPFTAESLGASGAHQVDRTTIW